MNNEYDVPKSEADCLDPSTPAEDCVYTIKSEFQGKDILSQGFGCMVHGDAAACLNVTTIAQRDGGKFKLVYAAAHCHAPACMGLELWNRDTGKLICKNEPIIGKGVKPVHDEKGYVIGIPPCLWGSAEEGLSPPPVLALNTNLTTIKHVNNTNGHWGVMGLWQMRSTYM